MRTGAVIIKWFNNLNTFLGDYYRLCGTAGCLPHAPSSGSVCLHRDEIIRVTGDSSIRHLEVRRGTIWLTATPAAQDIVLRPGDHFNFAQSHPYVLQAMDESEISLVE